MVFVCFNVRDGRKCTYQRHFLVLKISFRKQYASAWFNAWKVIDELLGIRNSQSVFRFQVKFFDVSSRNNFVKCSDQTNKIKWLWDGDMNCSTMAFVRWYCCCVSIGSSTRRYSATVSSNFGTGIIGNSFEFYYFNNEIEDQVEEKKKRSYHKYESYFHCYSLKVFFPSFSFFFGEI